ncbi:hypothetical protein C2S52_021856 [Perilla frutescens var. hirtella]|nr:hypothetical protein C2S52_021856 [Perilla frutescens var. hirtella]
MASYLQECCDICGDIGVSEALMTCCQCKRNTEHLYCMRIPLEERVDDWCCDECGSCSKPKPLSSCPLGELTDESKIDSSEVRKGGELRAVTRKLPNESRAGAGDWEKRVPTGKTKYISVKEALMLSTGEKKYFPSSSITCQPKTPRYKSGMCKLDRAAIKPRTVLLNFSSPQNLASEPLRPPKPQRPGNMEIREKQRQQSKKQKLTEELRSVSSLQPSETLKDTHKVKELPSEVQSPVTSRLVKQSPVPLVNTSPVAISGFDGHNKAIDPNTSYAENMSNNLLLDSEKYSQVPALDALWKGHFRIQDDHIQAEKNHLVQAHPPSRVRRKIYEFSKQMPEVLQFESVPSGTFWKNLFNEYIPDKRDIALYFFPGVGERSEENYILLVESLSSKNLALRIQIADVELLVFSSKLLPVNCQCWEGKYYLWGVFHHLKQDTITRSDNKLPELSLILQPSDGVNHDLSQVNGHEEVNMDIEDDVNRDQCLLNDREEVDMDIDMIGGIDIGIIEIPVQREALRMGEPTAAAVVLPESAEKITSISSSGFAPPSPNVKIESCDLIPPGFEEVYRLRIQSSSSPADNVRDREVNKLQTGR